LQPDVILALATALRQHTLSIPIVFVQVPDPVAAGFRHMSYGADLPACRGGTRAPDLARARRRGDRVKDLFAVTHESAVGPRFGSAETQRLMSAPSGAQRYSWMWEKDITIFNCNRAKRSQFFSNYPMVCKNREAAAGERRGPCEQPCFSSPRCSLLRPFRHARDTGPASGRPSVNLLQGAALFSS
jgi:hypothetical protein